MELKKREEIIKHLKDWKYNLCVACDDTDCDRCVAQLLGQSLALIKELTEEIKDLEADYDRVYEQAEADIHGNMADGGTSCHWCIDGHRRDAVRKMQEMLNQRVDQTINVFDFNISECNAIRQALRGVKNDIYQVAKELLEENK